MERAGYHGGFEHPVRAFVLGVALLFLLFGGFAVGIEAGGKKHPTGLRVITRLHVSSVPVPVVSTVLRKGQTKFVPVPGLTEYKFVVIRERGKPVWVWVHTPPIHVTGPTPLVSAANNLSTLYTAVPSTSYETVTTTITDLQTVTDVQTVTATETQTTTVTDTTTTSVPTTSNGAGSVPGSTGP